MTMRSISSVRAISRRYPPIRSRYLNVTFEPGCRNNWHIHHAKSGGGQILICVGGRGWYQEWGKDPIEMTPGTVINIPANVKHWHRSFLVFRSNAQPSPLEMFKGIGVLPQRAKIGFVLQGHCSHCSSSNCFPEAC